MSYRIPNPVSLSHEERMSYRTSFVGIFKDAAPEVLQDGSAIYTADADGRFYLHVFAGKSLRVCRRISGYYRNLERRAKAIEDFKQSRAHHHANRLLRRQAAKRPHTLKIGDVLDAYGDTIRRM